VIKILTATQSKQLDQQTIDDQRIASIDLMERACKAFVDWLMRSFRIGGRVGIVCGTGNNGGDGLGIARLLAENAFKVSVWIVKGEVKDTEDFKINLKNVSGKVPITEISNLGAGELFHGCDILIDAIFGSGLSRPTQGIYAQVIQHFNRAKATKISVDIPSGLMADQPSSGEIVKAHRTLSFQTPKLAFFFPENYQYVGEWSLLDIGLSKQQMEQSDSTNLLVTQQDVKNSLRLRKRFSHKGHFGHALLIAGSLGKMGACILAARAALRSGLGLLTLHVPNGDRHIVQGAVPEAMTSIDPNENYFSSIPNSLTFQAIGVGPGIGKDTATVKALEQLLEAFAKPMVLDADALNILADNPSLEQLIPVDSILTPHPKEFERLVGNWSNDFERLEKQRQLSAKINSVVILKGAFTSIAVPDGRVYFNPTGNPGMATGGTGDVLTGLLTSLLAQGYTPLQAAILGVYLHGLAGDLAARDLTMYAMNASDLVSYLPHAFKSIEK